jgi:hypothetical protein
MNKLTPLLSTVFLIMALSTGANSIAAPNIAEQQKAQKSCVLKRVSYCLSKCNKTMDSHCKNLCEQVAKNQCRQAGE